MLYTGGMIKKEGNISCRNRSRGCARSRVLLIALGRLLSADAFATDAPSACLALDLRHGQRGQLVRDFDVPFLGGVCLGKDDVNLLEGATLGFRVEHPDEGDEAQVDDAEEEERAEPADGVQHGGCPHDDAEVEQPVGHRGDGVGLGTRAQGGDFSGVQPRQLRVCMLMRLCSTNGGQCTNLEPRAPERDQEAEQTHDCAIEHLVLLVGLLVERDQAETGQEHGQCLAQGSPQEHVATAGLLNHRVREERGGCVDGGIHAAEDER